VKLSILGARVIDPASGLDQVTDLHWKPARSSPSAPPRRLHAVETIDAKAWWPRLAWST
jgi:dihydroorotase